tara:strand:- start:36 stop:221 length:186 start_codon:yes stop_codon:yes gene_type:complete
VVVEVEQRGLVLNQQEQVEQVVVEQVQAQEVEMLEQQILVVVEDQVLVQVHLIQVEQADQV